MAFEAEQLDRLMKIAERLTEAITEHMEIKAMLWPKVKVNITPEGVLASKSSDLALQIGSQLADLLDVLATGLADTATLRDIEHGEA